MVACGTVQFCQAAAEVTAPMPCYTGNIGITFGEFLEDRFAATFRATGVVPAGAEKRAPARQGVESSSRSVPRKSPTPGRRPLPSATKEVHS